MVKIVKKKVAFFASSPFQVISAVNAASFYHKDSFKVLFTFDKNIKSSFFERIYFINRKNKGFFLFYLIKTIFFPKSAILDQIKDYDELLHFDEIYCTDCNSLMCSVYLDNKKSRLHLIEDGARNFCVQKDHYSTLRKIMKFFSKPLYSDKFYDTVVFEPRMLSSEIKAVKEPYFLNNDLAKFIVYDIYKERITENEINPFDTIFFDQPFGFESIESEILKTVSKNTPKERLKFKLHPRSKNKVKDALKTSAFEPYFIKTPDLLNNLTLISVSSTVLFSSKIIFNKEPRVIFLHKIFERVFKTSGDEFLCYKNKTFDESVKRLENLYEDKTKVLAPQSISELESVLREEA